MLVVVIDFVDMLNSVKLLLDLGSNSWMTMADTNSRDTADIVKVALTSLIEDILHLSLNDRDWIPEHDFGGWTQIFFSHLPHLLHGG